jgi:hypothetical protein
MRTRSVAITRKNFIHNGSAQAPTSDVAIPPKAPRISHLLNILCLHKSDIADPDTRQYNIGISIFSSFLINQTIVKETSEPLQISE